MVECRALVEALALIEQNIPYDVAMSLDDDERAVHLIIFGKIKGGNFNWQSGEWEKKRNA